MLDVGCGSGVLAIAAAKLGFAPVLGVDHDPEAVGGHARRTPRVNGVAVRARRHDLVHDGPVPGAPLVLANLLRPLLLRVARDGFAAARRRGTSSPPACCPRRATRSPPPSPGTWPARARAPGHARLVRPAALRPSALGRVAERAQLAAQRQAPERVLLELAHARGRHAELAADLGERQRLLVRRRGRSAAR